MSETTGGRDGAVRVDPDDLAADHATESVESAVDRLSATSGPPGTSGGGAPSTSATTQVTAPATPATTATGPSPAIGLSGESTTATNPYPASPALGSSTGFGTESSDLGRERDLTAGRTRDLDRPAGPAPAPASAQRVDPDAIARAAKARSSRGDKADRASDSRSGGSGDRSLGELISSATKDLSTLVRKEIELAKAEVLTDVKAAGIGAGMLVVAGLLGAVVFLLFTIALAEGLTALGLPRWLSYLLVGVLYALIAGGLALAARSRLKKIKKPERTLETVKDDIAWAKHPTVAPTTGRRR